MGRNLLAYVSRNALRHNLQQVRKLAPNSKVIAMVKANAYGHGIAKVAQSIQEVDALGVASIEEALTIRHAGVHTNVVLMEGIFREDELSKVEDYNLTLVVHHWYQVQALQTYVKKSTKPISIWIKINTGMNRLGFHAKEFDDAYIALTKIPHVNIIGFMTHFAQADEKDNPITLQQYDKFLAIIKDRPGERSMANSAGILAWPQTHANWVRPGLLLYGASPFANVTGKDLNLLPAMTLRSEIIAIQNITLGDKVGYGGTWQNNRHISKIGIVAVGYGDGYPWHAQNGTPVLVNEHRVGTVGRISMDMLTVDISGLTDVEIGSSVTLWGEGLPIEEVAQHAGTIPYELFCRFTERVKMRVYN